MEYFLLNKSNYHKLISAEDEFYYPLIFQTSLLNARFIGKQVELKVRGRREPYSGMLIGSSGDTLLSYFKSYFSFKTELLNPSALPIDEDEHEWLESHLKGTKPSHGIKYISRPKNPPYFFLLSEHYDLLIYSSYSESELEELPEINYNKIITNEAIESLTSFVKNNLPKKLRERKKPHIPESLETKLKQLRISKFLKAAEQSVSGHNTEKVGKGP